MRLKARPNGVSCGPNPPMWQDVQGCCVWRAKEGTARASGANAVHMTRPSIHATMTAAAPCRRQHTLRLEIMVHPPRGTHHRCGEISPSDAKHPPTWRDAVDVDQLPVPVRRRSRLLLARAIFPDAGRC